MPDSKAPKLKSKSKSAPVRNLSSSQIKAMKRKQRISSKVKSDAISNK